MSINSGKLRHNIAEGRSFSGPRCSVWMNLDHREVRNIARGGQISKCCLWFRSHASASGVMVLWILLVKSGPWTPCISMPTWHDRSQIQEKLRWRWCHPSELGTQACIFFHDKNSETLQETFDLSVFSLADFLSLECPLWGFRDSPLEATRRAASATLRRGFHSLHPDSQGAGLVHRPDDGSMHGF